MADTRKDKRAPVSLKVRFKSATVDEFIEQYSRDVSRGGIFIKSGQPMAVGTLLKFQFQLKDESPLIKGVGRVVWTRKEDDATSEQPAGMGIKFIKMDTDSRAMVDRAVTRHEGVPGTYEQGDVPVSEPPPPASASAPSQPSFFPDLPPAQQPAPEDRTAVRHAAQFLASALSESGTDAEAAREAEEKAEEARRRTEQIEAERKAEAERLRRAQAAGDGLPSMIIDPTLSDPSALGDEHGQGSFEEDEPPHHAPSSERPTGQRARPHAPGQVAITTEPPPEDDTNITDMAAATAKAKAKAPSTFVSDPSDPLPLRPEKRSSILPVVLITAAVVAGGFLALRASDSGPADSVSAAATPAATGEPSRPAAELEPEPGVAEPDEAPEAAAAADDLEQAAAPEAPEPAEPVERVAVVVNTRPEGADVLVDGEARGRAPISIELPKGREVTVRVEAEGRLPEARVVTPTAPSTPLSFALAPMPYVLHVDTDPPGAVVLAAGRRGKAPIDLKLAAAPKGAFAVNARLPGYTLGKAMVDPEAFSREEDAMRASITLTLERAAPRPTPKPQRKVPKPAPVAPTSAPEADEPAPVQDKAEPKAEPAPKPASEADEPAGETIPDNPFG